MHLLAITPVEFYVHDLSGSGGEKAGGGKGGGENMPSQKIDKQALLLPHTPPSPSSCAWSMWFNCMTKITKFLIILALKDYFLLNLL